MSDQDARLTVTTLNWGVKVYVDARFNFDPEVIAVTEEMFLHRLDCLD
jgi:hypothetical protein